MSCRLGKKTSRRQEESAKGQRPKTRWTRSKMRRSSGAGGGFRPPRAIDGGGGDDRTTPEVSKPLRSILKRPANLPSSSTSGGGSNPPKSPGYQPFKSVFSQPFRRPILSHGPDGLDNSQVSSNNFSILYIFRKSLLALEKASRLFFYRPLPKLQAFFGRCSGTQGSQKCRLFEFSP